MLRLGIGKAGGVDVEARDWVSCTTLCIAGVCSHPDTNTITLIVYPLQGAHLICWL